MHYCALIAVSLLMSLTAANAFGTFVLINVSVHLLLNYDIHL